MTITRFMLLCWIFAFALSGCRQSNLVTDAYHDRAREILVRSLDAWRDQKLRGLSTGPDAVRFVDDDQKAGWKLKSYSIVRPEQKYRPFDSVAVTLELVDPKGTARTATATYQISVAPHAAVLRADP